MLGLAPSALARFVLIAASHAATVLTPSSDAPVVLGPFESVQVDVDASGANILGDAANEPSIAVDPNDSSRMAIGWRHFSSTSTPFREAAWAWSHDGGRTWNFSGSLEPGVERSDPVLASDSHGNFYYASLRLSGPFHTSVCVSTDGGISFGPLVDAFGGDKQWIAIDRSGLASDGALYQEWNFFGGCCGSKVFNRSLDGAQTFEPPTSIAGQPRLGTLAVGPAGELYVCGWDTTLVTPFLVARSTNASDPLATPSFTVKEVELGGLLPIVAGPDTPNPAGLHGQAWIDVDPTTGHVYALSSVDPAGLDPLDVHLVKSVDGGATWSAPLRINDDPPGAQAWQWFAVLSVAPNGRIDIAWVDTRASGVANVGEVRFTTSNDGGASFAPSRAVTPAFDSHVGWPQQAKLGDYYHMVSDAQFAHLAYAATFNGEQDVYYLRIPAEDRASAALRNGVGLNAAGFAQTSPAVIGGAWETVVDLAAPGSIASAVVISLVPIAGEILNGFVKGELLCAPPFELVHVAAGKHAIAVPPDLGLVGVEACAQALVFDGSTLVLQNAIDVVIGVF